MLISWNWLKQYVDLDVSVDELTRRLTMSGLNHESTSDAAGDLVIDLEVTSNRPDCLGHLGVAREVAALFDKRLRIPAAQPATARNKASELTSVAIECPDLCPRYIARVIRGVKVGPSPSWMQRRLAAVGISTISNVVDATNYVLLECSQPLHAFDYDKLREHRIVVRRAKPGETIIAIDQREYELAPEMCVIADARRPVAIGGVMGGFDTEVGDGTTNLLIEAAEFDPVSIRNTARALGLHSESSYRFERTVDPEGVEWASRRVCELILETAGGELAEGSVEVGQPYVSRETLMLRFDQVARVLGIEIQAGEATRVLEKLGLVIEQRKPERLVVRPPSWRRDLTREIDLVEEVGRVHGYEAIPEDVQPPMAVSPRTPRERVRTRLRNLLSCAGLCEVVTFSFVDEKLLATFSPWSSAEGLSIDHPSRRQERFLRMSLVPSLLARRRYNESRGHLDADLYELADVYLPNAAGQLPDEPTLVALVAGCDFLELKGIVEELVAGFNPEAIVRATPADDFGLFGHGRGARLTLNEKTWGYLGEVSDEVVDGFGLRTRPSVAELRVDVLESVARLTATYSPLAQFPPNTRDLTLDVDEAVTWQDLADVVRAAAGDELEEITFRDVYRGQQVTAGKGKSVTLQLTYRAPDRTLTGEEVDRYDEAIVEACATKLGAVRRG